jgi:hypothetical protein
VSDLLQDAREKLRAANLDILQELIAGDGIFDRKIRQISEIMRHFSTAILFRATPIELFVVPNRFRCFCSYRAKL